MGVDHEQWDVEDGKEGEQAHQSPLDFEVKGDAWAQLLDKLVLVVVFRPLAQPPNRSTAAGHLLKFPVDHLAWMPQVLLPDHFLETKDAVFRIRVPILLLVAKHFPMSFPLLLVEQDRALMFLQF